MTSAGVVYRSSVVVAAVLAVATASCGSSAPTAVSRPTNPPSSPSTDLLSPSPEATVPITPTTAAATVPAVSGPPVSDSTETTAAPVNSVALPPGSTFTHSRDATDEVVALVGDAVPAPDREALGSAVRAALNQRLSANGCDVSPAMLLGFTNTGTRSPVLSVTATFGCDDSVGGVRYRVTLTGSNAKGWTIASATREDLCLRGTDGTVCT